MKTEILYQGSMPAVLAHLEQGEALRAESGAMVYMDPTVDVEGHAKGGIAKGLGRLLTGESFFVQEVVASRGAGKVMLAPANIGNIIELDLDGRGSWYLQKGAFLCSETTVNTSVKTQSLTKGLFSGEGLFIIQANGHGKLFLNSFGAIHKIELNNEEVIIDNGHLVAWDAAIPYEIKKASKGLVSSFTSGEGLVTKFRGSGTIYIQTRNFSSFIGQFSVGGEKGGIFGRLLGGG